MVTLATLATIHRTRSPRWRIRWLSRRSPPRNLPSREMRRTLLGGQCVCQVSQKPIGMVVGSIGVKPARSVSNLMSDHSINDPKHWLDRAKEARALAEQIGDPEAKRTMLKNADDYERR
jgi:hypothetical protein